MSGRTIRLTIESRDVVQWRQAGLSPEDIDKLVIELLHWSIGLPSNQLSVLPMMQSFFDAAIQKMQSADHSTAHNQSVTQPKKQAMLDSRYQANISHHNLALLDLHGTTSAVEQPKQASHSSTSTSTAQSHPHAGFQRPSLPLTVRQKFNLEFVIHFGRSYESLSDVQRVAYACIVNCTAHIPLYGATMHSINTFAKLVREFGREPMEYATQYFGCEMRYDGSSVRDPLAVFVSRVKRLRQECNAGTILLDLVQPINPESFSDAVNQIGIMKTIESYHKHHDDKTRR